MGHSSGDEIATWFDRLTTSGRVFSKCQVRSVAEEVCGNETAIHWVDGETGLFEGYDSEEVWLILCGEYDWCVKLEPLEPYDGLSDVYWDDPAVCGLRWH